MSLTFSDAGDNTEAKRRARVRRLSGNLTSSDISDNDIDEIINRHDDWMLLQIDIAQADFTSSLTSWKQGLHAGELMSAAEINDGIPTNAAASKAKDQRIAARDIIRGINRMEPQQAKNFFVAKGVNVQDQLEPEYYIQDQTENLTGID